jgi:FKBP-type peptidyl-prolyl cis-trans isomerase 2
VHYDTFLEDGSKIDSSVDRNLPYQFEVGAGQVVKGFDVAVKSMSEGMIAEVTIPHIYAYGEAGCPPEYSTRTVLQSASHRSSNRAALMSNGNRSIIHVGRIVVWDNSFRMDSTECRYRTFNAFQEK